MKTRRMGMIAALLLTAALFVYLPGPMRALLSRGPDRAHDSLRPPKLRSLVVWVIPGQLDDRQLIAAACSAFEQANPGARIFLRSVPAQELYAEGAVLPDVLLFEPGDVALPERALVPLADASAPSGMHAGLCYAVPLWLSPGVLCMPADWMQTQQPTSAPGSLLGSSPPPQEAPKQPDAQALPWVRIAQSVERPEGVALQQLLAMCPPQHRSSLVGCESGEARVLSLREFTTGAQGLCGVVMTPAVSDHVRMGALCRDGAEGAALLRFLQLETAERALAHGLICPGSSAQAAEEITRQSAALFSGVYTLPNAFAHSRSERHQLCLQGFLRMDDPVTTLLRLR